MKKYWHTYKMALIENLVHIHSFIIGFFMYIAVILVFVDLWKCIYSGADYLVKGYSFSQIVWYILIGECVWLGIGSKTLTNEIIEDIKLGTIVYRINKPYNYICYIIFKNFGDITLRLSVLLLTGILFGVLFLGPIKNFNIINLPAIIFTFIVGIFINCMIRISISLLSFWIEDSRPFHRIYNKLSIILGVLFPIDIFPVWMQSLISYTPIYAITQGPIKLAINFNMDLFIKKVLIVQCIYVVLMLVILQFLYRNGVKNLNVNGC